MPLVIKLVTSVMSKLNCCVSALSVPPPDNDLEPGLFRTGDKEPGTDHQSSHRCGSFHVFQHGRQFVRHHLQRQESPTIGAELRKPAAGA